MQKTADWCLNNSPINEFNKNIHRPNELIHLKFDFNSYFIAYIRDLMQRSFLEMI